jgi:transposase-like protein
MADNTSITTAEETLFSGLPQELLHGLSPVKTRAILLYVTGQYTLRQIASVVGVADNTIRTWLHQEEVQQVIRELQTREFNIIDSSLKSLRMQAVETMRQLMDSPMDAVRFQASKDLLDRTGHKPATEMKVDKTITTIESQLKQLADITIEDAEVIDISDLVERVKDGE